MSPAAEAEGPPPPVQQPLSVSWRDWIRSPAWDGQRAPAFDAIVVGSGYGGSVAALRLGEKGYRVLLLERGSEFLPGEFPNDFALLPKFFRVNVPTSGLPMGRASGLVEVHLGQGMVAVTGNGLGGGSLINAGVVIQPDADVFAQPQWPAAIRNRDGALQPYFEAARRRLGVHRWDSALPGDKRLHKSVALASLAGTFAGQPVGVDLTIDPDRCRRCGDCASGCNVPGAKQTLAATYLRAAVATGQVQVVTQAEVYRFDQSRDAQDGHAGWQVEVFATDAQQQFLATREVPSDQSAAGTTRRVAAPMLFVCAGTLGSTQLLQRSQSRSGRLSFSPALGTRVSGNGDSISWVLDEEAPVANVGTGAAADAAWDARNTPGYDATAIVGPTITGALDRRHDHERGQRLPLEQRLLVQDAAIPRAIAQVYRELLATVATLRGLDDWWTPAPRHAGAGRDDPLAATDGRARHAQVLLVMGHDGSPARLAWLEGHDRSAPYLPDPMALATYQAQQRVFDRLGTRHAHNPLWQALPRDAERLMSGAKPTASVTTVHPLGGCVMSDHPLDGVVNDRGQVWVADPGRGFIGQDAMELAGERGEEAAQANEPRLYRGLYVLDGAIVPTALGCNPLWTITALAERALDFIPARPSAEPPPLRHPLPRAPQVFPSRDIAIAATLHETLQAREVRLGAALAKVVGATGSARLEASFHAPDLPQATRELRHAMEARARLVVGPAGPDARVVLDYASEPGARFEPLPASRWSAGPWLFWRGMGELLLLAIVLLACAARWNAPGFVLGVLAVAVLSLFLPLPRAAWTWLILRGWRDIREGHATATGNSLASARALLKQLLHASEKRVMRYRIPMTLQVPVAGAPRRVMLHATKTVMYRASIVELLAWCARRGRGRLRPTVWEQVMNARVRVVRRFRPRGTTALLAGTFEMGFDNLMGGGPSSASRARGGALQLGPNGDATSGMLALASYPLLFLRFALKTRLLEFRLPTYSQQPVPDQAPPRETWLRTASACIAPEQHWITVERGASSSDRGDEGTTPLRLQLWRYRRRDAEGRPLAPLVEEGTWLGVPVARARSVLLLHAFGQSGLSYTLKTVDQNLAEAFHAAGYEVWVLETRMSTRSGHAGDAFTVDQIAAHDIPGAVRHILGEIGREAASPHPLQVAAFAQCIGSAALWMALLSGRLSHETPAAYAIQGEAPRLSMLSHFLSSQVHPWLVGARGTQSKSWMPAVLQALCRRGAIPFAVRGPQEGQLMPLLDRIFASMPAPVEEDRHPQGNDDAAATCRRIRYIEAPLFEHANINDATFSAMHVLFGDANLRLFAHARRFVEREQLVDEDGGNAYVTADNLQRHLAFPVQLLHGQRNALFDPVSAQRSFSRLGDFHASWQQSFCTPPGAGQPGPLLVPGHGHLDVLIGKDAATEVFPSVIDFFDRCLGRRDHDSTERSDRCWMARAPRIGPFVGWTRMRGGQLLARVSFVLDDRGSGRAGARVPIVVRYRPAPHAPFVTLRDVTWRELGVGRYHRQGDPVLHRFAWADLPVPQGGAAEWQVLSLHPVPLPRSYGGPMLESSVPDDHELDAFLEAYAAGAGAERIEQPVSDGARDYAFHRSLFQLPRSFEQAGHRVAFAVGCCRHPGFGLDANRVNQTVSNFLAGQGERPASFALLLGDQIYADATAGLLDPTSPLERYYERHEVAFDRAGLGQLLAAMPVYMTPDDHEWIEAFPSGSPLVRESWPRWDDPSSSFHRRQRRAYRVANRAMTAFQRLQTPMGPRRRAHYHLHQGCVRIFVIDSRLTRERNDPRIVAPRVLDMLETWLAQEGAEHCLNVVASGSVVLPVLRPDADPANPGPVDTWMHAPAQRQLLLERLVRHRDRRFLLLSGDYHVSGAALVQHEGRTVGAAVLAPPLHAPLPYANTAPESVFMDEVIPLGEGGALRLVVPEGGQVARGSGLGVLDVHRVGGGFEVAYGRKLWVWESGSGEERTARFSL